MIRRRHLVRRRYFRGAQSHTDVSSIAQRRDSAWTAHAWPSLQAPIAPPPLYDVRQVTDILVDEGWISSKERQQVLALQRTNGGSVESLLANHNIATPLSVARATARRYGLTLYRLMPLRWATPQRRALLDLLPFAVWRDHLMVPVRREGETLVLAMVNPTDTLAIARVQQASGLQVRPVVTAYRDVMTVLQTVYRAEILAESRDGLRQRRPHDSASTTITFWQFLWVILVLAVLLTLGFTHSLIALVLISALAQVLYLCLSVSKLWLVLRYDDPPQEQVSVAEEYAHLYLDRRTLPVYTVLVPAYREARVLPKLAAALRALDYPHDRLDVKLLLEADDVETIEAARALQLPNFIDIVVVPPSEPRTKPKACNYGLQLARGEYVVVYDAEDIPEPDQLLKAIAAFRRGDPSLVCVQGKLTYFNPEQNLLTRWFAAEYITWFDNLLPALHRAHLPIPLGGTSNHFKTAVLRELDAWDAFNVAEDADLGIRLSKMGYQTAMMHSFTYEEANCRLGNWIRQRSRWIKGYMQTWLVHMRAPLKLYKALGGRGFIWFQLIIGGTPLSLLVTPFYALLTTLWFLTHLHLIELAFPGWIYFTAAVNLFIGTFCFTYMAMVAVSRRGAWSLLGAAALSPIYWSLMSLAAWKALAQLIIRPSYWEKTDHGLVDDDQMLPAHLHMSGQMGGEKVS